MRWLAAMNVSMSIQAIAGVLLFSGNAAGHGTVIEPISRVYRVYLSNPEGPDFVLAAAAVAMDGTPQQSNQSDPTPHNA